MVKRYEDCVPASNPDYHAIKHLLDLLTTTPTMSRYDFLNKVRFTLRESCCVKVRMSRESSTFLAHNNLLYVFRIAKPIKVQKLALI